MLLVKISLLKIITHHFFLVTLIWTPIIQVKTEKYCIQLNTLAMMYIYQQKTLGKQSYFSLQMGFFLSPVMFIWMTTF